MQNPRPEDIAQAYHNAEVNPLHLMRKEIARAIRSDDLCPLPWFAFTLVEHTTEEPEGFNIIVTGHVVPQVPAALSQFLSTVISAGTTVDLHYLEAPDHHYLWSVMVDCLLADDVAIWADRLDLPPDRSAWAAADVCAANGARARFWRLHEGPELYIKLQIEHAEYERRAGLDPGSILSYVRSLDRNSPQDWLREQEKFHRRLRRR